MVLFHRNREARASCCSRSRRATAATLPIDGITVSSSSLTPPLSVGEPSTPGYQWASVAQEEFRTGVSCPRHRDACRRILRVEADLLYGVKIFQEFFRLLGEGALRRRSRVELVYRDAEGVRIQD